MNISKKLNPLVTVYIPTYNRVDLLKRAVESVRQQSYENLEIIIVDDCSTDTTHDYLRKVSIEDERIRYFLKEKNSGACVSRNIAIENAKGEFITGLDDDDYFSKDRIKNFLKKSDLLNEYEFLFDSFYIKKNNQLQKIKFNFLKPRVVNFNDLLMGNYVGNQIFILTRKLKKSGGFDSYLTAWQDLDMWLNLLENQGKAYHIKAYTYVVDIDHPHERITKLNKNKKIIDVYNHIVDKYNLSNNQRKILATQLSSYGIKVNFINYLRFPFLQFKAIYFIKWIEVVLKILR